MALTLHPDCRNRLVDELTSGLERMVVEHRRILRGESLYPLVKLDEILPERRASFGLGGFFDDRPLMDFVYESISDEIKDEEFTQEKGPEPLKTLSRYADPRASAEDLISRFETLPWDYKLLFKTSFSREFESALGTTFQLGRDLRLVLFTEADRQQFIFPSNVSDFELAETMFQRSSPRALDLSRYYLEIQVKGFVGHVFGTEAIDYARARIKAFTGLSRVLELQTFDSRGFDTWNRSPILVFRVQPDDTAAAQHPHWFTDEDVRQLQSARSAFTDVPNVSRRFELLRAAFENNDPTLTNAGRWFFDSHSGSNEVLSFVQAMVVLEILFGDKATSDILGIGRLISNRCAYSIGATLAEREQIISTLTESTRRAQKLCIEGKIN